MTASTCADQHNKPYFCCCLHALCRFKHLVQICQGQTCWEQSTLLSHNGGHRLEPSPARQHGRACVHSCLSLYASRADNYHHHQTLIHAGCHVVSVSWLSSIHIVLDSALLCAVLCQELVRFNALVEVIHASLKNLQKALKGQVGTLVQSVPCPVVQSACQLLSSSQHQAEA